MSVVDEIKSKLDIVDYISRTVPLKRAGRTYKACCPFHNERTPSFNVDPQRQSWRCFGACSTGGDVISFAMRQNGWSFNEALTELGKLVGVDVQPRSPEQQQRDEALDRQRGLLKLAVEYYHDRLLDSADADAVRTLEYARRKRGLNDETIQRFAIGYAPQGWQTSLDMFTSLGYSEQDVIDVGLAIRNDAGRVYDRFRNRLMVPIRDERGRPVGFGARALAAEDNPKYLNSPQSALFDKSKLLFGLDLAGASIRQSGAVVIVEGYMDAIQAHQAGYSNVVAQMGTALTETQLKLVAPRWATRIILALDSDAAGQSATMRSLEVARQTLQADYGGRLAVDIRILSVPGAKDPDDLIREHPEQWAALVEDAVPVADYVIAMETASLNNRSSLQEREAIARRLLPILAAAESDLYKKDNLQKLALKLHIAERDLLSWAADHQASAPKPKPAVAPNISMPEDPFGDLPPLMEGDPEGVPTVIKPIIYKQENALERDCLRLLLLRPELVYHINRRLRELANQDAGLLAGPLNDLRIEDFSHNDYRALASVFSEALEQDEVDVLTYMRQTLQGELLLTLEMLLQGDLVHLRPRLRYGLAADLDTVETVVQRVTAPVDPLAEAVEKALRLRDQRLKKEREELEFLQRDEGEIESALAQHVDVMIMRLTRAKLLIDNALKSLRRSTLA